MKVVVQRVNSAYVTVENTEVGRIGKGLLLLLGIDRHDTKESIEKMIQKTLKMKIGVGPEPWLIWITFTLHGSFKKGSKPDFHCAMSTELAREAFANCVAQYMSLYRPDRIQTGSFGEYSQVSLENDGPIDSVLLCMFQMDDAENRIWNEFQSLSKSRPLNVRTRHSVPHFDLSRSSSSEGGDVIAEDEDLSPKSLNYSVPEEGSFQVECPSIPPLPPRPLNPRAWKIATLFVQALMDRQVVRAVRAGLVLSKFQNRHPGKISRLTVWIEEGNLCWRNAANTCISKISFANIVRLDYGKNSVCFRKLKKHAWNCFSLATVDRSFDFFSLNDELVEQFLLGFSIMARTSPIGGLFSSSAKLRWTRALLKLGQK